MSRRDVTSVIGAKLARVPPLLRWTLWMLPAVMATLHSLAILPIAEQALTLEPANITPFEGYAYVVPLPPRSQPSPDEPAERIFENGRLVPYPNMPSVRPVAAEGGGRYRINGDSLYFSASDNSDPRANGRVYTVRRPYPIHRRIFQLVWLVAIMASLIIGVPRLPVIARAIARPSLGAVTTLFVVLIAANRLWYFTDFGTPAIHPDSGGYYSAAEQIGNGTWPNFGNRPPVYPIFLKAIFAVVDKVSAVIVVQTLLSVSAAFLLVLAAYRWHPFLGLPAALVMSLFLFGSTTMEHDTALLSESLYTTCLMASFAGLLLAIRSNGARWFAFSATAMALAILTRPAGVFLEVIYAVTVVWLLFRRFPPRAIVAFAVPFPVLLLAMCTYNWRVVGVFATTTWGEANFAGATLLIWQTDPSYPPEINQSIEQIQQVIQKRYVDTKKDPTLLERSWNLEQLRPIFLDGFNWEALTFAVRLGGDYEQGARPWIRRVAFDAIRKKPVVYAKFVATMMYYYFVPFGDYDFRAYLHNRGWQLFVDRTFAPDRAEPFVRRMAKEFSQPIRPAALVVTNADPNVTMDLQDRVIALPTTGWRIYDVTHRLRGRLYDRWFWPAGWLVALLTSTVVLTRSRFTHHGAFAVFILTLSVLGASLVVSLVEWSQPRYSYPMEWAYGLSVVLLPLVFLRPHRDRVD